MKNSFVQYVVMAVFLSLVTGCSLSYTIHEPQVSSFRYNSVPVKKVVIKVVDQRKDLIFQRQISNLRNLKLELKNVEDPIKWFAIALEKELVARGVPAEVITSDKAEAEDMSLIIKTYQIVSHRMTGFSPWETYHSFKAELKAGNQTNTIIAYFTNGHVPKWSMKEVEKQCFDIPMSIVVKDVASKINQTIFKLQAGKDQLDSINGRIEQKLATDSEEACLPAIEMGATNNQAGLPYLLKLVEHKDQFLRACSLSAIGTLGAKEQLDLLKVKFAQFDYVDQFMALKAIGDIGTPEAIDFIKKTRTDSKYQSENGYVYFMNLYMD